MDEIVNHRQTKCFMDAHMEAGWYYPYKNEYPKLFQRMTFWPPFKWQGIFMVFDCLPRRPQVPRRAPYLSLTWPYIFKRR